MSSLNPELARALDENLSALEVIKVFTKHHFGALEDVFEFSYFKLQQLHHSDSLFWDLWRPLLRDFQRRDRPSVPISEPFLSVHKDLTREVISWLSDSERKSNVYLIAEAPTKTDKINENYRAHALAAVCWNARRFGQPLQDEPLRSPSISLLCEALATYSTPFRLLLAEALIDNPEILKLPTRIRFKKLICEPWRALQESYPQYVAEPPVVVLRWNSPKQKELFRAIYEFASLPHTPPLLWIISFSPESKLPIHDLLDLSALPRFTRVPVCYEDAPADTALFLDYRFEILRQEHEEMFSEREVWPSPEQMSHLTRIFSGAFDSIDVVCHFVNWGAGGGPKAHLETFLAYMDDSPSPSDEQPYCALDHFYTQALCTIPPDLLLVAKLIFCAFYRWDCHMYYSLTAFQLACLFSIAQDTVLDVLPYLSRWAVDRWPSGDKVVKYSPNIFFGGFLKDPKRSGRFYTRKSEFRFLSYGACLHLMSRSPSPLAQIKSVGPCNAQPHFSEVRDLMDIPREIFYYIAGQGSTQSQEWALLRSFDFRCLVYICDWMLMPKFAYFLRKLHAWDKHSSPNIVRVEPVSLVDRRLVASCEGFAESLDLEEKGRGFNPRTSAPKYVLLGLEARTVLVLLATTIGDEFNKPRWEVTIYTSAMLGCM